MTQLPIENIEENGQKAQDPSVSDNVVQLVTRCWSVYQQAIFADLASGQGHTVIEAVAGSGKSTTLVEGVRHVPAGKTVLVCAFGRDAAASLVPKVPTGVDVRTTHGLGFGAVRYAWRSRFPKIEPDKRKEYKMARKLVPAWGDEDRGVLLKLVGFCKAWVVTTEPKIRGCAGYYDCRPARVSLDELIQAAQRILLASLEPSDTISYDDMIYIPVALGIRPKRYDVVVVDETQDLGRGQVELALSALRPGGRIIAVGDRKQAIFGFRGADSGSMERLIARLKANVLPLSVTYRCPRAVVAHVQPIVPQFEAGAGAPEGVVDRVKGQQMVAGWAPGDFVLSRVNAPLVGLCLKAWKQGIPAAVLGRDVGEAVRELVDRYTGDSITGLIAYVTEWCERESARLKAADKEDLIDAVNDRAATLISLCEGMVDMPALRGRIDTIFVDPKKVDPDATLMFSSTHKAKGLETDRVWMLERTYRYHPDGSDGGAIASSQDQEEANLYYVGCTRAKRELHLVQWDPKTESLR